MDVGTRLREARLRRGLTLHDLSAVTKLSIYMLEAIERNDLASLPGGLFRRAYLRAYAAEVGLNPKQIVSEYLAESASEGDMLEEPQRATEQAWAIRWRPVAALAICVALVGYGAFFLKSGGSPSLSPAALTIHEFQIAEAIALTSAAPVPVTAGRTGVQLEVQPRDLCWVSVRTDGRLVIYRLMQPGERAVVQAHREIVLRLGDAGSFVYWINGSPGRTLGEPGEAVTIHITEDNYETFLGA